MTKRAIDYVGLIGKYVRMERFEPMTPDEAAYWQAEGKDSEGGEGIVARVDDIPRGRLVGGPAVGITFEDGYGFYIFPDEHEHWNLTVYTSEEVAGIFSKEIRERLERIKKYREDSNVG